MKAENAIEVKNVTKYFKAYEDKGNMLRERIIHLGRNKYKKRIILDDISFEIKKGEAVALIGKNGCGKSTTLKMLTKILRPNSGSIEEVGRISSLIELGAGFHPDLTGRENIYINASIFGIKAKEVDKRMDDIIRFSELEDFIDDPVRTYSSGMYMRLAFAVAINVKADILLIDEILAVGDSAFQTKCFNKLKSLKEQGTTIVLVSHSLEQVKKICDRAIWIDKGQIRKDGPVRKIVSEYLEVQEEYRKARAEKEYQDKLAETKKVLSTIEDPEEKKKIIEKMDNIDSCRKICKQCGPDSRRSGTGKALFKEVILKNGKGMPTTLFSAKDSFCVELKYDCFDINEKLNFIVGITREDWIFCYGATTEEGLGKYITNVKEGKVIFNATNLNLVDGKYYLDLWIKNDKKEELDCIHSIIEFTVSNEKNNDHGVMVLDHDWIVE